MHDDGASNLLAGGVDVHTPTCGVCVRHPALVCLCCAGSHSPAHALPLTLQGQMPPSQAQVKLHAMALRHATTPWVREHVQHIVFGLAGIHIVGRAERLVLRPILLPLLFDFSKGIGCRWAIVARTIYRGWRDSSRRNIYSLWCNSGAR